jgi:hypothetical protein
MTLRFASRTQRELFVLYGIWSMLWVVAHVAGGLFLGAGLGAMGMLLPTRYQAAGVALLSILCLLWALRELQLIKLPMPQWQRQVQQHWLGRLPWNLLAVGFGVQLGCAVATRIKTAITYAALCAALLVGSPIRGAIIMGTFGLARALPALIAGPLVASPERSMRCAVHLDRYSTIVARAMAGILMLAAVGSAWGVWAAVAGMQR